MFGFIISTWDWLWFEKQTLSLLGERCLEIKLSKNFQETCFIYTVAKWNLKYQLTLHESYQWNYFLILKLEFFETKVNSHFISSNSPVSSRTRWLLLRSVASIAQVIFEKNAVSTWNPASLLHAHVTEKEAQKVFCQRCLEELFSHKHFKIAEFKPESALSTQPSLFSTGCDYIDMKTSLDFPWLSGSFPKSKISPVWSPLASPAAWKPADCLLLCFIFPLAAPDPGLLPLANSSSRWDGCPVSFNRLAGSWSADTGQGTSGSPYFVTPQAGLGQAKITGWLTMAISRPDCSFATTITQNRLLPGSRRPSRLGGACKWPLVAVSEPLVSSSRQDSQMSLP